MLTLAQFKVYANYSFTFTSNQDAFVSWILEGLNEQIEREIGTLFNLVQIDNTNPDPRFQKRDLKGCNMNYLSIGAWQPTGLTVQIGSRYDRANLTTLTFEEHYDYHYFDNTYLPGYSYPVTGLQFVNIITSDTIIRLTGTYGFSNGMPFELEQMLYNLVQARFNANIQTSADQGQGRVTEKRSQTVNIKRETLDSDADYARKISTNILADPIAKRTINKYKTLLRQTVTVS